MKKVLLSMVAILVFFVQVKSQDVGITGFVVPATDTTINLGSTLPLTPILRNYGPVTIIQGDTIFVKILIDNVSYGTSKLVIPAGMTIASGESVYINFSSPINLSNLTAGTYLFCFTTNGSSLGADLNSINNKSCFMLTVAAPPNPTLAEIFSLENVSIFPNPANEIINISSPIQFETIYLNDLSGRVVYHYVGNTSELRINTQDFPTGIYFMTIQSENEIITKKIQISR